MLNVNGSRQNERLPSRLARCSAAVRLCSRSLQATSPGLSGRLNPILDTSNRTYLYAPNIAITEGEQQPVSFVPGEEEIRLTDSDGNEFLVRVVAISGQSALLEYRLA